MKTTRSDSRRIGQVPAWRAAAALCLAALIVPHAAAAQSTSPPVATVQMPPVTVTAQKEPADAQTLPVSVSAVQEATLDRAGVEIVSDASIFAPNTFFSEFSARKLSNATFRGIGSSPANAGITTFIDGVPQLNTNSSSIGLRDVEQIEFVRGPQSALFGRNTLGGLINVVSRRPLLTGWAGQIALPFGTEATKGIRGSVSGPLNSGNLGLAASFDYGQREGYTTNVVTGNDVDHRESFSGKVQVLWTPSSAWEARLIVSGERDRDGDYALGDLDAIRADPFNVARDYEGRTDRDVTATTFLARRQGARVTFSSVTGVVTWRTHDLTDLDYSPMPLITRDNLEEDLQFTQEVRFASNASAPIRLSDSVDLHWQAGLFLFTQNYDQDAVNSYAPYLISQFIEFPIAQTTPKSALDDVGVGAFAQATFTAGDRLDLSIGARFDREQKDANLQTFFTPAIAPPTVVIAEDTFSDVSPQASIAFRPRSGQMVYASFAQGFKAGGFNPAAPAGSEAYGEEQAWHAEAGWKSSWAAGRVTANAALFYVDWQDLQLNVPNPFAPGQFYIANVGGATSRGVEVEVQARPNPHIGLFSSVGYTRARFTEGSVSSGADVSGHLLQNTPEYTAMFGVEATRPVANNGILFGRVDAVFYGAFQYDPSNTAGQDAYSLTNLRAGIRAKRVLVEAWVRNAFDTRYVPLAFSYVPLAPSGFLGEPGRPRTFGTTIGMTF